MSFTESELARFWRGVTKSDGCWEWIKSRYPEGYGKFDGYRRTHRMSWEIHFGPIPDGLHVLHHCDNGACVRPDHLFLGTNAENVRDKTTKGRAHRMPGENHPLAKVTAKDVQAIRSLFAGGSSTAAAIAREHSLSPSAVRAILIRKTWPNVPPLDTMEDATIWKRFRSRKPMRVLTPQEVRAIRDADPAIPHAELGRLYGVSYVTIRNARKRRYHASV